MFVCQCFRMLRIDTQKGIPVQLKTNEGEVGAQIQANSLHEQAQLQFYIIAKHCSIRSRENKGIA